jgi:small subunit ribosomal protein S2
MLTNANLEDFIEAKLILAVDPIPDKNVINDASKLGIPVIALCDSNNESKNIDLVVPCNNKGKKSLAVVFFVLAREFLKNKELIKADKDFTATIEDFTAE